MTLILIKSTEHIFTLTGTQTQKYYNVPVKNPEKSQVIICMFEFQEEENYMVILTK